MPDVTEINDPKQMTELRPHWDALLALTPRADFFHTLDWLEVYWRHYGDAQKPRVLVVSEAGKPLGILPLTVCRDTTRLGPFRILTFPLDDWGSLYQPIGPNLETTLLHGLRHIRGTPRDWDFLELRWMNPGADEDAIAETMREAGLRPSRRAYRSIPLIDTSGSWDDYWASRSGNWRSNCRRNEKKLAQQFDEVEHLRYRPAGTARGEDDPRFDLFDACEQIARHSWQGSSRDGTTLSHPTVRPFLRDVHEAAARAGCLDVNLLLLDGQPAAFNYNYVYRGYVSGLRVGFDPAFSKLGVGTLLARRMIQDSFERGDHTLDLLPGSLAVKRNWQTSVETNYHYSHFPVSLGRVQLLRLKRWLSRHVQDLERTRDK